MWREQDGKAVCWDERAKQVHMEMRGLGECVEVVQSEMETCLNTSDLSPIRVGSSAGVSSCSNTPRDRSSYTFVDRIDIAIATHQHPSPIVQMGPRVEITAHGR